MYTLHYSRFIQLRLGHTTYTRRAEIRFLSLNTFQAAKLLVSLFLPSRN